MTKSRDTWGIVVRALAAGVLVVFVVGAIGWFIATVDDGTDVDAAAAFIGFGYFAGIVLVAILAMLGWRLLELMRNGEWQRRRRPRTPGDEHAIIRVQMAWGSMLVIIGAAVGLVCLCILPMDDGESGPVLALATAVISAGAVLLPAGAAGSASARLQQQLAESRLPTVVIVTAERTRATEATIKAVVTPNMNDVKVYVEFQEILADGSKGPKARKQEPEEVPASAATKDVTLKVELQEGKTYQVRLVAETTAGASSSPGWTPLATVDSGDDESGGNPPPDPAEKDVDT